MKVIKVNTIVNSIMIVIAKNIIDTIKITVSRVKIRFTYKKTPLGRWNLHDNNHIKRIDYSNVDHCGPCGNNHLIRQKDSNI
jgi:hypothetical protein